RSVERGRPAENESNQRLCWYNARTDAGRSKRLIPAEQLGINLREFLQELLELAIVGDGVFGGLLLGGALQEELVHLPHSQALSQVVERAVFVTTMAASARALAADGVALDKGSANGVRTELEQVPQPLFALAQSQGGFAAEAEYPSHIYG